LACLEPEFIYPDWPAAAHVKALTTTRIGGFSEPPFDSFNLSLHSGDNVERVQKNRTLLVESADLPTEPLWLRQVHGNRVVDAAVSERCSEGDGSYVDKPGHVCVVLTADCCPVFLCDRAGGRAAVLHGGWRGLALGLIEQGVAQMDLPGTELMAWLGPAIGPHAFEVGEDVYDAFVGQNGEAKEAFTKKENGRWLADIYGLARQRLRAAGVTNVYGGGRCTVSEGERFFSYRRDRVCGHMASLIWLDES
jgi:YfiH family protein